MLSVLIPTYNYNVYPLVYEMQKQLAKEAIDFEIIVLDDASTQTFEVTKMLQELPHVIYKKLENNMGRTAVRQQLAQTAQYDNLLFMDADTFPKNPDFVKILLETRNTNDVDVIYGGVVFQDYKPKKNQLLRWVYARSRESLTLAKRQEKPYLSLLSTSILIKKKVFLQVNEALQYKRYGLDILFGYLLKKANFKVLHINNPVYHFGLETSAIFIQKSKDAIDTSIFLVNENLIPKDYKNMDNWHRKWAKFGLCFGAKLSYMLFHIPMEWQLKSSYPSLKLFDWYRYGYYCLKK